LGKAKEGLGLRRGTEAYDSETDYKGIRAEESNRAYDSRQDKEGLGLMRGT
jgi:hypothetical protein